MNLLVGTGVVSLLKGLLVIPLARTLARQRQGQAICACPTEAANYEAAGTPIDVPTGLYVLADMLVLGCAGFIAGLLGYWWIGIAWKAREWPGVIACSVASFVGMSLRAM